jgi:AcrR family transcriptional regulator
MSQLPRPAAGGDSDWQLPRGRHRLPFQVVVDKQRRRLLTGVGTALAEQDYAALTVKHVIAAAGVSRRTFYAYYDNKQGAVLVAHRDAFERLLSAIVGACASEREWPLKVRAAIAATFALLAEQPGTARLLTLGPMAADPTIGQQVRDSNAHLAALLRDGRRQTPYGPTLPGLVEEGLIGAASTVLGRCLLDPGVEGLRSLEPEVLQILLTPYVGMQEAARVARSGAVGANGRDPGPRP